MDDPLPVLTGLNWSITIPDAHNACQINNNHLTCTLATMDAFDILTVQVSSPTTFASCGHVSQTATVSALNENPLALNNNTATASTDVLCPALALTKQAEPTTVFGGDPVQYTIQLTNSGLGDATNVVLTDPLPTGAGLSWSLVSSVDGCAIQNGTLSCNFATLASNTQRTIQIHSATTEASCGTYENTATVTASNHDSLHASATLNVECVSLTLQKTTPHPTINAGELAQFTVTLTNNGQNDAHNVTLTDPLPANSGMAWQLAEIVTGCTFTNNTLSCSFPTLVVGEAHTFTFSSPTTYASCGTLNNQVQASDSYGHSASASATVTIQCPSLQLTQTADQAVVGLDTPLGFTLQVSNTGAGAASNIILTDSLPANVSWSADNAACTIANNTLTCNFSTLAAGAQQTVHLTGIAQVAACGTLTVQAHLTAANHPSLDAIATTQLECADITVTKTADQASITPGDTAGFTVIVHNQGNANATQATLTDSLPANVTWSLEQPVTGCTITNGTLSCSWTSLAAGATVQMHVTGPTSQTNCGTLSNTANVSASNEATIFRNNNTSTAVVQVSCVILNLTKTTDTPLVTAGDPARFTLIVSNNGNNPASNITLTDSLPTLSGMAWQISPGNSNCSLAGNVLTCTFASLSAGQSSTVTVISPTTFASCGTLNNLASVADTSGHTASANASITVQCPALHLTKTANAATVSFGSTIGFTMEVSNTGTGIARNVTLTDPLPASINWSVDNACTIANGTMTCAFGDLPAGAVRTVHLTGPAQPATCGLISNTATLSATNHLGLTSSASLTITCPDLTLTKTADQASIKPGETAAFTLTVGNNGTASASNITLTDPLPAGVTWSADNTACTQNTTAGVTTLTCAFPTLAVGAQQVVHLSGLAGSAACVRLDNTASVSAANEPSGSLSNNTAQASITVDCGELTLEKTTDTPLVSAGEVVRFTLTVRNNGTTTAQQVTLTDALPTAAGLVWHIDSTSSGCTLTENNLSCTYAELPSGQSQTITVSSPTTFASCGTLINQASVTDAGGHSKTASASVTVQCPALSLIKTANNSTVEFGQPLGFTLTASNSGTGAALNATLTDSLPANITWTVDNSACSIQNGTLTCSFGRLSSGTQQIVHLSGDPQGAACGHITNNASLSASNHDTQTASAVLDLLCANLHLSKTADQAVIDPGGNAAFTLTVTNQGTASAEHVRLNDTLPAGIAWSVDTSACSITNGVLSCDFGSLAAGSAQSAHLTGPVGDTCGTIHNVASVSATNEPGDLLTNNSASATITVNCVRDLQVSQTVNPQMTRTYSWIITKRVDRSFALIFTPSTTLHYTVTVKQNGVKDRDWKLTGMIHLTNPNLGLDITNVSLFDKVDNGGDCSIQYQDINANGITLNHESNPPSTLTVAANTSVDIPYICTYDSKPDSLTGTHTVKATWDPSLGTPSDFAISTASFTFGDGSEGNPNRIYHTVTAVDSWQFNKPTTLGTVTGNDKAPWAAKAFSYTKTVDPLPGCNLYLNVASIAETGRSAGRLVMICRIHKFYNSQNSGEGDQIQPIYNYGNPQ